MAKWQKWRTGVLARYDQTKLKRAKKKYGYIPESMIHHMIWRRILTQRRVRFVTDVITEQMKLFWQGTFPGQAYPTEANVTWQDNLSSPDQNSQS